METVRDLSHTQVHGEPPVPGGIWCVKNSVEGLTQDISNSCVKVTAVDNEFVTYEFIALNFSSTYKNTYNSFKEMFFFIKNEKTLDLFLELLDKHTLDPTRFDWNGFLSPYKVMHYHPRSNRTEIEKKEKAGLWKLSGNFNDIRWGFEIDVTEEQVPMVLEALNKHTMSERFQKEVRERYNAVVIRNHSYFDKDVGMFGTWYTESNATEPISLDVLFSDKWGELYESYQKKAQNKKIEDKEYRGRTFKHLGSDVSYKLTTIHWREGEFEELNAYIEREQDGKGIVGIGQAQRITGESSWNFKPLTLVSTGRRLEIYVYKYGWAYREIDPIVK